MVVGPSSHEFAMKKRAPARESKKKLSLFAENDLYCSKKL